MGSASVGVSPSVAFASVSAQAALAAAADATTAARLAAAASSYRVAVGLPTVGDANEARAQAEAKLAS